MKKRSLSFATYQYGQSAAEFVVAMLILAPMFIILPKLGDYMDVAHNTTIASRFAGFETSMYHTVYDGSMPYKAGAFPAEQRGKEEKDTTEKVQKYFFSHPSAKNIVDQVEVKRKYEDQAVSMSFVNLGWKHGNFWEYSFLTDATDFKIVQVEASLKALPWESDVSGPTKMTRYTVVSSDDHSTLTAEQLHTRLLRMGPTPHYPRMAMSDQYGKRMPGFGAMYAFQTRDDEYGGKMLASLQQVLQMETRGKPGATYGTLSPSDFMDFDLEIVPKDRL